MLSGEEEWLRRTGERGREVHRDLHMVRSSGRAVAGLRGR